jgi:hypothetical protein
MLNQDTVKEVDVEVRTKDNRFPSFGLFVAQISPQTLASHPPKDAEQAKWH